MNLNIKELIEGRPERLRYVFRYSTTRVISPESVAEHSYFVAFYCMMIGHWLNGDSEGVTVSMRKLLERALVHDLEEAVTGDFPREFKHSNKDVQEALKDASRIGFVQIITALTGDSDLYIDYLIKTWTTAKANSPEGL